ncbi:hypothetical protein BGX27_001059 [Mortierella sp. AM989]|nr:hypothetical protein BGX27_001059 [Mortierella sp. AM989]
MAYITKDQLNLYLQQVNSQSTGPGANGTTRSRSTLSGPRPPTFGIKANSRKIFQDGPPSTTLTSPRTPTIPQLDSAVKSLSLSPMPGTDNRRSSSPILESMGESGPPAAEPIMESMGSDGYSVEELLHQQRLATYGSAHGQQGWPAPGYNMGHQQQQYPGGYTNNQPIPPQFYQQQQHQQPSVHMSQEQYLLLQQQQQQQQQEYLRQQHAAHAAVHGYYPAGASSTHLPNPATSSQVQSSTKTPSITPRIVPIVDIPKYTTINPPKAEVTEEQDDDWAPELPPRDSPKSKDANSPVKPSSQPRTHTESAYPLRPPSPKIDVSQKPAPMLANSPRSKPTTLITTENSMPTEEDRVPLPPPREFRRKSNSPTTSTFTSSILSARPSPDGIFRPTPPSKSSSSSSTSTNSSKKSGISTSGTVRANSAKFNAMAAEVGSDSSVHSPKAISPKVASSVVSSTSTSSSASSSPWTTRKAVDQPQRGSSTVSTTSLSSSSSSTNSSRRNSVPVAILPPEAYAEKDLPPIKPNIESSSSRPNTPPRTQETQESNHAINGVDGRYELDHDSKCIVTEENTVGIIPLADDASKEIVIEEQEPVITTITPAGKSAPPKKPARSGSTGSGTNTNQGIFACASCDEPISGMMITAMGKRWHSDHFVCCVCDTNLEHVQFFQKDGQPYCHLDYHEKFSPKCGHCNTAIENECLSALGKSWHPGHFFCRECGDPFDEDGYMVHDDFPYCEKDYLRLFAPKCAGCLDPIQGDFISALKGKWHRDCFGCTVCHIGFDASSYYVENGKPFCQTHYKTGAVQPVAT